MLNGQEEILRLYATDTIQYDESGEGEGGAEEGAGAPVETPVIACSLHWCVRQSGFQSITSLTACRPPLAHHTVVKFNPRHYTPPTHPRPPGRLWRSNAAPLRLP